ncbi:hypothetical protein EDB89DRAFT_1905244 [Lactarius sanguifluus]|nr:hypothetical protein EDB89DRAFT_1905244 [Lactarius sanguifluus]
MAGSAGFEAPDIWRYVPEPIRVYLPRRGYCRFGNYLGGIREVARGIVRKSIVKGDGRDIMGVILRANNSRDPKTKPPMARSLIRLRHDTSTNPLTWFFWELPKHPESARDLCEETAACSTKSTGVTSPHCLAAFEKCWGDIIPVAFPITTKSSEQISVIPIRKGARVDLYFCSHGRSATVIVEGPYASGSAERRCQTSGIPNGSTVLDQKNRSLYDCIRIPGGVRGCLGWRFAVIEMQVIPATLLENFEFSLPPQTAQTHIIRKPLVLMVPMVEGIQYPWMGLKVRRLKGKRNGKIFN